MRASQVETPASASNASQRIGLQLIPNDLNYAYDAEDATAMHLFNGKARGERRVQPSHRNQPQRTAPRDSELARPLVCLCKYGTGIERPSVVGGRNQTISVHGFAAVRQNVHAFRVRSILSEVVLQFQASFVVDENRRTARNVRVNIANCLSHVADGLTLWVVIG